MIARERHGLLMGLAFTGLLGACAGGLPGEDGGDDRVRSLSRSGIVFQGPVLQGAQITDERVLGAGATAPVVATRVAGASPRAGRLEGLGSDSWHTAQVRTDQGVELQVQLTFTSLGTDSGDQNRFTAPQYDPPPPDAANPNSDIELYDVRYRDDSGRVAQLCPFDASTGAHSALILPGIWETDVNPLFGHQDAARFTSEAGAFTIACTVGALSKCTRWGYKPWARAYSPSGGWEALAPYHQACVRGARADVCGNGLAHTRNGGRIDIHDRAGFILPAGAAGEFIAEGAYGENGPACVAQWKLAAMDGSCPAGAWSEEVESFTSDEEREHCVERHAGTALRPLVLVDRHVCEHPQGGETPACAAQPR